jgi:N-acetylglutamate synthase-like GNAT family acetyltransferase
MNEELDRKFSISTDKSQLDLAMIHDFLKTSYWAKDIPKSTVEKSITHSLCFGVYQKEQQIGFARVISDYATFAYLADVFILESYRGQGLGKWLIKSILAHSELQNLRKFLLGTRDAHELYRQFGFNNLNKPEIYMEITNRDPYHQLAELE